MKTLFIMNMTALGHDIGSEIELDTKSEDYRTLEGIGAIRPKPEPAAETPEPAAETSEPAAETSKAKKK